MENRCLSNAIKVSRRPPKGGLSLTGLTLIELLLVVVLVGIVVGVVGLVFRQSLDTFRIGEAEVSLQRVAQSIMEEMIEGTDKVPAMREALEVSEATETSLGFIPFWMDSYSDYREDSNEFTLSREVKPGSSLPIGQVKIPNARQFSSMPTIFIMGKVRNPSLPDDKVRFINPIPKGSNVRILFCPDASLDDSVIMRYYWDNKLKRLFRRYNGKTEDIIRYDHKVKVTNFKFSYYDNLNRQIEAVPLASGVVSSSSYHPNLLSAIGIEFSLERDSIKRQLSSFVSIRTLGGNLGTGIALSEGTELNIPDSAHIRMLVLDNISGIEEGGRLEIEISSSLSSTWKISIDFGLVNQEPYITGFNIEYPKGTIAYSNNNKKPVKGGLNLLKSGNDYYDYDDDINIEDIVKIEGDSAKFKVLKMNIGAAAVFVRP
ncbi:MAG: hypothetical protein AABY43_03200 [Candidatus Omnitrophota bacterium]